MRLEGFTYLLHLDPRSQTAKFVPEVPYIPRKDAIWGFSELCRYMKDKPCERSDSRTGMVDVSIQSHRASQMKK